MASGENAGASSCPRFNKGSQCKWTVVAEAFEEACCIEGAEVDDVVAQPHPGTGVAVNRRENAERQVGEREIVPFRHLDPGGHGRVSHGAKVVHDGGFIGAFSGRADWIKNTELAW